jgi:hypothetical protein
LVPPVPPAASSERSGTPSDPAGAEIAREQLHVDRVYERLEATRARARAYEAEGHRRAQFGHEGGLVERDSIVYQAAAWLQRLDAEEEGLVFGRLDLDDREVRYIGRLGVRDEEYEPLTVDWRRRWTGAGWCGGARSRAPGGASPASTTTCWPRTTRSPPS